MRKLILAAVLTAALPLVADEAPAKWYDSVKFDGFADAYYKYNPNGIQTTGSTWKTFDQYQNEVALGGGRVGLKSMDGAAVLDVYFGDYAKVLAGNLAPAVPTNQEQAHLGQAFYAQAYGPLTLTLGRYMTHVGFEVTDSVANWNFTRGLLYGNVPFFHTGVKLAYAPMDGLSFMVQADDGNSTLVKSSEATAAGAQIAFTKVKGLALYGNYYYEPVLTTSLLGTVWEKKHYLDFVGSYNLMDGLDVAGEYLYMTQIAATDANNAGNVIGSSMPDPASGKAVAYSPKAQGYAFYINYSPLAGFSVTPRFEAWYMPDSFQSNFDTTLTLRYTKGILTNWIELRGDTSTQPVFAVAPKDTSTVPAPVPYSEMTATYAVGYKF